MSSLLNQKKELSLKTKPIKWLLTCITVLLMGVTTLFAQALHTGKGEVIAVRFLELKPDVNIAEFENFAYKTFNPGFDGAVPGLKEYIAKSDRGMNVGS